MKTAADEEWERRYLSIDPAEKAYGGVVKITLADGTVIEDAIECADAHLLGAKPFIFGDYVEKFRGLTEGIVGDAEQSRFIELVNRLAIIDAKALEMINPIADAVALESSKADSKGIF